MTKPFPSEKTVALDKLAEFPGNPRQHGEAQVAELRRSLELFGQYRPLVLNEKNEILAGNGMYRAMVEMGWKEGRAVTLKLSDADQKKLVLADNQIARMGFTDYDAVDDLLKSIGDFEIPGYDPEAVKDLVATAEEALEDALEYGSIDLDAVEEISARGETYDMPESEDSDLVVPPLEAPKHFTAPTETAERPGAVNDSGAAVCSACGRPW